MENENFGQKLKRKTKSFFKKVLIVVVVLGIATFSFLYWWTYETGVMSGRVLSISQRGIVFETYEGKLSVGSFGSLKGANPISETRDFSVESGEKEVIEALEKVSLSGEQVNLRFKRRLARFPWRGETKYFVYEVERSK